jgi:hypothetical protein
MYIQCIPLSTRRVSDLILEVVDIEDNEDSSEDSASSEDASEGETSNNEGSSEEGSSDEEPITFENPWSGSDISDGDEEWIKDEKR